MDYADQIILVPMVQNMNGWRNRYILYVCRFKYSSLLHHFLSGIHSESISFLYCMQCHETTKKQTRKIETFYRIHLKRHSSSPREEE